MNALLGSRRRRLTTGLAAQTYSQAVNIGVQLVSVPVLLWAWGADLYGVWLLISAVPAYLSLADLGFAQVGASDMTMRVAKGDREHAKTSYDTIFAMNCALGVIAFLGMAGFALSPWSMALVGEDHASGEIRMALLALAANMLFTLLQGVLGAGLRAEGHFATGVALFATMRLVESSAAMIAALSGGTLLDAALAMLACRLVATWLIAWQMRRRWTWLGTGFGNASFAKAKEMLGPSLHFTGYTLGNLISIQGTLIVVGVTLGPAMVALASTARTLARVGVTAANMLNFTLQPEYSSHFGRGEIAEIRHLFRLHIGAIVTVAAIYLAAMLTLGPAIYTAWTHNTVALPTILLALLALGSAGDMLWTAIQTSAIAMNRMRLTGICYLIVSCAVLASLLQWTGKVGVVLVGWTSLASACAMILAAGVEYRKVSIALKGHSAE